MKQLKVQRNFKDRVFRLVFQEKKDLLELYNAVAGRQYTNPEALIITTIDDAIYLGMKNDLSFLVSDILNLYEHQSSFNPNMPLRGFSYFSDLYQQFVEQNQLNLYGSGLVKLPTPQYVVFYNGTREEPDVLTLKLSDAFVSSDPQVEPCLECKATMLNINHGHNRELMNRCGRLREYALFVSRVRENEAGGMPLAKAVDEAVTSCIRDGILANLLSKNRAEVRDLILYEYDEQKQKAIERREGFEEGRIEGLTEGEELKTAAVIRNLLNRGIPDGDICALVECSQEMVDGVKEAMRVKGNPSEPD